MLNREKYADEIIKYALGEKSMALKNGKIVPCDNDKCEDCDCLYQVCDDYIMEWLNSEYVELVDQNKVPIDTKILVRNNENQNWNKRYFAEYDHGIVRTWTGGKTSWSADGESFPWNYAKLAEDIKQPRDDAWHNLKDKKPEDKQEVLTWDGLGVHEDRWSDDADYFECTDAKEIWWREMPEPPEV